MKGYETLVSRVDPHNKLNYLQAFGIGLAFGLNLEADLQAFGLNFDTHKCINQITEKELHFWQAVVTFLLYNRK